MAESDDDLKIRKLIEEILPPLTQELEFKIEDLRTGSLADFAEAVSDLITEALMEFSELVGIDELKDLGNRDTILFLLASVAAFNSVIPPNHPYIVIITCVKELKKIKPQCIRRSAILGIHDMLRQRVAPLMILETLDELEKVATGKLKVPIQFKPPDSPEEYFN